MRAKPEMVHVALTVTHVKPPKTVIVAPLMPVVVKETDRVVAARVTDAVVVPSAIARLFCVTYPDADAL